MTAVDLATFLAVFARAAAFIASAPLLGDKGLPVPYKAALAAVLAAAVSSVRPPLAIADLPLVLPVEIVVGLMAGFMARAIVAAAEAGGELIGISVGLGFASTLDPTTGDVALPTRRLMYVLTGLALLAAGFLPAMVAVLAADPVSPAGLAMGLPDLFALCTGTAGAAVRFAAPTLAACLVANVGMALASRAAPALNLFSLTLPGLLVVGAGVLLASGPYTIHEIGAIAERAVTTLATFTR